MKCILLCGGFAKRLWPLTLDRPKALLDVGGRAILDRIIDKVECLQDVDEVIISTNAAFEPVFRDWLSTRTFTKPVKLVVEPSRSESEKFGAIKGLAWLFEQAKVYSSFMVIAGDNVFDFELSELVKAYNQTGSPTVALYDVNDIEKAKMYGTVKLNGTRIEEFHEKSPSPPSTLASTGCYIFPRTAIKSFAEYLSGENPKDAPGHFIAWLSKKMPVHGWMWRGAWFDIGDFASLDAARAWAGSSSSSRRDFQKK
jgi:glucose-1-phosphate thymidylyltransferase